jgi:hypothetical protein
MKITDLYGTAITITDFDRAINQAEMFSRFGQFDLSPEQPVPGGERKAYWADLYEKLLQLQSNLK